MDFNENNWKEILESNKFMAKFAGVKPEIEYSVGSPDGKSFCYSPKNIGIDSDYDQKLECVRWLKENPKRASEMAVVKEEHYPFYHSDLNQLDKLVDHLEKNLGAKFRYDSQAGICSVLIVCCVEDHEYSTDFKDKDRHTALYQAIFKMIHKIVTKANF